MYVRIRGIRWTWKLRKMLPKYKGHCDPPDKPRRWMGIDPSLKGKKELDATVHELLHAAYWDLDEAAVDEAARDISAALWKLGWRKEAE